MEQLSGTSLSKPKLCRAMSMAATRPAARQASGLKPNAIQYSQAAPKVNTTSISFFNLINRTPLLSLSDPTGQS